MAFSRRFPRDVKGSPYPVWEEVYLSDEEERRLEQEQHAKNLTVMRECIADAARIVEEQKLRGYETSVVTLAVSLFEKRASHAVFWKEEALKEKFDKAYRKMS
jgi:hypothetical protein